MPIATCNVLPTQPVLPTIVLHTAPRKVQGVCPKSSGSEKVNYCISMSTATKECVVYDISSFEESLASDPEYKAAAAKEAEAIVKALTSW